MDESLYYKDDKIRAQIDELLIKNMMIECRLGTDSTEDEKLLARAKQDVLFEQIKKLDEEFYKKVYFIDKN